MLVYVQYCRPSHAVNCTLLPKIYRSPVCLYIYLSMYTLNHNTQDRLMYICYLTLRGDPLSQRVLFQGSMESLQTHTHTVRHNTCNHKQSNHIHTHCSCVVSSSIDAQSMVAALALFQVVQGAGLGLNPCRTSHLLSIITA